MDIFPNAEQARAGSRNNIKIYDEIRAIELEILEQISQGNLTVTISDSPMTNPISSIDGVPAPALRYYQVAFEDLDDRSLGEQMDLVQQNFTNLGYTIVKLANAQTGTTFVWSIQW